MTGSPSVVHAPGHTLSLSARLAGLEADVAELNELRRQRAELDLRIADGERAERLLTEAETILLQLLDGEAQPLEPAASDASEVPQVEGDPEGLHPQDEEPRNLTAQEPAEQEMEPQEAEATGEARELEPEDSEGEDGAPYRSSFTIVSEWVWAQSPGREFGALEVSTRTGVKEPTVKAYLRQMERDGHIEVLPREFGKALRYQGVAKDQAPAPASKPAVAPSAPPSEERALPPIPAKLSTDECSVYDALRRVPGGMSLRLVQARLNWGFTRTANVLQRLIDDGYVGRNGDLYRVFPEELRVNGTAD